MDTGWNILGPEGLQFFGKITSTTTHELNNAIGVINEHAGLLGDLGWMAKQGNPADIDRWIRISKKITDQVQLVHKTINNLNRFAHSTDHTIIRINPEPLLCLILSLTKRILAEKKIAAKFIPAQESIEIVTAPFLFLNLMGRCLVHARDHADQTREILVHNEQDKNKYRVRLSGIRIKDDWMFPDKIEQKLLKVLDAEIKFHTDKNSMSISMISDTSTRDNKG